MPCWIEQRNSEDRKGRTGRGVVQGGELLVEGAARAFSEAVSPIPRSNVSVHSEKQAWFFLKRMTSHTYRTEMLNALP